MSAPTGPTLDDAITRILLAARELNEAALMLCAIKRPAVPEIAAPSEARTATAEPEPVPEEPPAPPTFGRKPDAALAPLLTKAAVPTTTKKATT